MELEVGLKGTAATLAERSDTALEVGSGDLLVYATPCMAALMEGAACEAIAGCLKEGQTTVGTALNIAHTSATPVGMEVRAEAEVTAVEGKVITFSLKAFDESGEIGKRHPHPRHCKQSEIFGQDIQQAVRRYRYARLRRHDPQRF